MYIHRKLILNIWNSKIKDAFLGEFITIAIRFFLVFIVLKMIINLNCGSIQNADPKYMNHPAANQFMGDQDIVEVSLATGEKNPTRVSDLIQTSEKLKNPDHAEDTIKINQPDYPQDIE